MELRYWLVPGNVKNIIAQTLTMAHWEGRRGEGRGSNYFLMHNDKSKELYLGRLASFLALFDQKGWLKF